jgi:O-antigen ligase
VFAACGLLAGAAAALIGVLMSLSRMGLLAFLFSLVLTASLCLGGALSIRARWMAPVALTATFGVAFIFLPADALIARFADMAENESVSADTRARIWSETLPLVRDFPVFGCGLGGYESSFSRYRSVGPQYAVDYAHNDYLQLAAELGLPGFAVLVALAGTALASALRRALQGPPAESTYIAAGAAGALGALALHSFVDFNLYVPANAIAAAWAAGLACSCTLRSRPAPALARQERGVLSAVDY